MPDDPAYIREFKRFTRGDPTVADLEALERELYGANDRASAVMLGAFAETALERLLRTKLRPDLNSDERRPLFDSQGPLGNFSSKIAMAYAMGTIGPITRDDLDLVRLLRNGFAHTRKNLTFDMPVVTAVCARLKTPDLPGAFIPYGALRFTDKLEGESVSDLTNPRTRYRSAVHTISSRMLQSREGITLDEFMKLLSAPGIDLLP
jgi:hypothetical protein